MSITQIRLRGDDGQPPPPPAPSRDPLPSLDDLHSVPILLIQLQDELARSRRREALWLSVILHMIIVAALLFGPRYLPGRKAVLLATPGDLLNNRELTYLAMPPDQQKPAAPRRSDIISDKDRVAMSRTPTLDRKELQKILDSARAGAPGNPGQLQAPAPPPQMAAAPPQPGDGTQRGALAPQPPAEHPALESPLRGASRAPNPFSNTNPGSAGSMIAEAARAAAASRGGGGSSGDYGLGIRGGGELKGNMEILSDTMGVDFGPYLSRVLHDVRQNWYTLIPEIARAPLMKRGQVSIEFAILKDGKVAGLRMVAPSGDASLDRAAWGGITASNPFPPLPGEYRGDYLALRFHFFYNPDRNELR